MGLSSGGIASVQQAARRVLLIEAQRAAAGEVPGLAEAVLVPHVVGRRGIPPGDLCVGGDVARRADGHHVTDEGTADVVDASVN